MFARTSMDLLTSKRLLDEKCQTIEQLKDIIEELKLRHEKNEQQLIKHIGILYNDLQQSKKKLAHFILKYQKQKKSNEPMKIFKDFSTQTDEINSSSYYQETKFPLIQKKKSEQYPRYYALQSNKDNLQYISAIPQSSPSLSTTDPSSRKHNESSSSAYNTADSLPSTYSDEIHSLERVLNAACTMYTTKDNLEHTIKLQEELFRQRLRLRGIDLNKTDNNDTSSEHFYDNIDSETSEFEKQAIAYRNRSLPWYQKKQQRNVRFSLNNDVKMASNKMKSNDQYYSIGKRKNTKNKKLPCQHSKLLSSNMLTVTIT